MTKETMTKLKIYLAILSKKTWALLGLLAAGAVTSQIAAVNHFLSYHPHLAPLGGFIVAALLAIHNPMAQDIVTDLYHQFCEAQKAAQDAGQAPPALPPIPPDTGAAK